VEITHAFTEEHLKKKQISKVYIPGRQVPAMAKKSAAICGALLCDEYFRWL
jgi:hypothetical protein